MARKRLDLLLVMAAAALALGLAFLPLGDSALRLVFGLPLALLLPGYALTAAAFPLRALSLPEQVLLSLGLSLALAALGGLLLNLTPWGLQAGTWALLLGGATLGAGGLALWRQSRQALALPKRVPLGLSARQGFLLGLAALIALGALGLARFGASQQATPGFTQLWILPAEAAGDNTVRLGISSHEAAAARYKLQIKAAGAVVGEWPSIALDPGGRWETTIALPTSRERAGTVEALLYRADDPDTVYRRGALAPPR